MTSSSSTGRPPIETILAGHIVKRAVYVAPFVVLAALLWRGAGGAVAAGIGVGVVLINYLLAGFLMSATMRISLGMYHAAAILGFFFRMALVAGSMLLAASLFDIDRMAFGLAAVVSYLLLLALEMVAMVRGAERELEWGS